MITMSGEKAYKADLYLRLSREKIEELVTDGKVANVSTDYERERESGSISTQRAFLTRFCEENGINIHNIYADDGYSGANFDRPGWKKMIKDIEDGKINMVIVKDLSRLGRVSSKVTYYTDEYFPEHRVRFVAVADAIDSSGKIDYLCVSGITAIHQAFNYVLPIISNELTRGDEWEAIKGRYWNIFLKMLEL